MTTTWSQPRLTVAISLFNYGHYIERAIESICKQTIAHEIELIIVNDASTDNSEKIVNRFQYNHRSLDECLASFYY